MSPRKKVNKIQSDADVLTFLRDNRYYHTRAEMNALAIIDCQAEALRAIIRMSVSGAYSKSDIQERAKVALKGKTDVPTEES